MQGLAYCASRFATMQRQLEDNLDLQLMLDEPMQASEAELRSSCQSRYLSIWQEMASIFSKTLILQRLFKVAALCKFSPE